MERFKKPWGFAPFNKNEALHVRGHTWFTFRAEKPATVYVSSNLDFDDEILAGYGVGEFQVDAEECYLRVKSQSRVWARSSAKDQTPFPISEEVFTSLDRPAALPPEVVAIQRMIRRNELEREKQREEMERFKHEIEVTRSQLQTHAPNGNDGAGTHQGDAPKGSAKKADSVREEPTGVLRDPAEQADSGETQIDGDTAGDAEQANAGR